MVKLNPYRENMESVLDKSGDVCQVDNCYAVLTGPDGEIISSRSEPFSIEFFSRDRWQTFEYMTLTEKARVEIKKSVDSFIFVVCTNEGLRLCDYRFPFPIKKDAGFTMDFSPMNALNAEYLS